MAGTYTNSASGAGMRYGMHAYIKVVVTDTSNTVCRVRVECWAVSDGGYSGFIDGRCSAYAGGSYGSWTGHDQDVTAGGSTRLNYAEFNVDRGTSNRTVTYWAQIKGTSTSSSNYYYGCSESVSVEATIPKISTEKPNAPTDCSAAYVSDSSVSVSWTNGSTTSTKPRTATLVERSTDGGTFVQIASVGGTASSYADNGTTANHSYAYRVRASNAAGYSSYATTGTVYTTPAAPSAVTLDKTAATTVQVGIEGAPPYATGYNVERTQDGGSTWANVGTGVSLPLQDTVEGGTVKYRVAAVNGSLVSPWAVSEAIVTICPPLAPTITQQPANPTVAGTSAVIAWTPNHPDGTSQTAAQVKFDGTTHDIGADTFSYSQTVQVGSHTVQVRTKGLDADWGAWSSVISFNAYNPPSIVIDSPSVDGETVAALPLYIEWGVTDTTGVSTQRVTVTDSNGTDIYNRTQGANVRSLALTDSDISLQNGGEYSITVRVMGGSGLIAEAVRTFAVNWAPPAIPALQIAEGEGASAQIVVDNPITSASGAVVEAESSILASLTIHGKSVQDGTPSPSSPVEIQSVEGSLAELFEHDFSDVYNATTNPDGYWRTELDAFTQLDDGWAHFERDNASGTSQSQKYMRPGRAAGVVPADTYTIMAEAKNNAPTGTGNHDFYLQQIAGNQFWGNTSGETTKEGYTTTTTSVNLLSVNGGYVGRAVRMADSTHNPENGFLWTYNFRTDAGATNSADLRFSLYRGKYLGVHVPYDALRLGLHGRNMARNPEYWYRSASVTESGGVFTKPAQSSLSWIRISDMSMPVESLYGKTFTLSLEVRSDDFSDTSGRHSLEIEIDGSEAWCGSRTKFEAVCEQSEEPVPTTSWVRYSYTFSIPDESWFAHGSGAVNYAGVGIWSNTLNQWQVRNIQLELGSTATEYEQPTEASANIDLNGNALRSLPDGTEDTLEVDGEGNVTLTKRVGKVTFDGSETWYIGNNGSFVYESFAGCKMPANNYEVFNVRCDRFSPITANQIWVGTAGVGANPGTNAVMRFSDGTKAMTVEAWKTWLASNPTTVLYPLAEPQTIQLGRIEMPYIDGTMHIDAAVTPTIDASFRPAESADTPPTESVTVQRVNADGTIWTVASNLPLGGTCIDPLPPLGVEVVYIATATAASGATASESYSAIIGGCRWALNFGQAAQTFKLVGRNPNESRNISHGGTLYHFADGGAGDGLPVLYETSDRDLNGSLEFDAESRQDAEEVMKLLFRYPRAWIRDPFGNRRYAFVNASDSRSRKDKRITVSWDATRFTEAW